MSDQMSLDGILNDEKPAPREPAESAPEPQAQPKDPVEKQTAERNPEPVEKAQSRKRAWQEKEQLAQGRVRDPETGQFAPKVEKTEPAAETPAAAAEAPKAAVAVPQQEFTDKEKAFLRAAQEERGKRQELERRLAAMEATKATEPPKQFWDDPEGAIKAQQAQMQQIATDARIQTAEMISRQAHPDFEEKLAIFAQIVQSAPHVASQAMQQPNPAEFAYQLAKNHMQIQEAGNIDQLRAKIEKETEARVRTQIEAELKAKADALARERAALPPSLSDARSSGTNRAVWGGPTSLDNILKS